MKISNYIETDKKFYKDLVKIAVPVALQSLITTGVNLVDNIMLGKLGETAMNSAYFANQFIMLFTFLCMGISMGSSVMTSRFYGAKDEKSLKKVISVALKFAIILAAVFTLANVFGARFIMSLYTPEQAVIDGGVSYLLWSTVTFILMALSTVLTNIMRSIDMTITPIVASAISFGINIFANYCFIFGNFGAPEMGIAGAAVGTVIARIVETGVILFVFLFKNKVVKFRMPDLLQSSKDIIGEFFKIAFPVLLSDGLLGIGENVLASIMGHISEEFVSANSITMVVQRASTIIITGIAFSGCFLTGRTLGEGRKKDAERQGWTMFILGAVIGLIAAVIIEIISAPIIESYNITDETKEIAYKLMDALALIIVFRSTNSILTKGVLRGGGDTRFLVVADMTTKWLLGIPLGYLAGIVWHFPMFWIFIFLHMDEIVKAVWCAFRMRTDKWIKKI